MERKGIREIAVIGVCGGDSRREMVRRLSRTTPHSLVLSTDDTASGNVLLADTSVVERFPLRGKKRAVVHRAACSACGRCVEACPAGALSRGPEAVVVDAAACIGCGVCVGICRRDALLVDEPVLAWCGVSIGGHGRIVHGSFLRPGFADGEGVDFLLERARREAKLYGMDRILIDVPDCREAVRDLLTSGCRECVVVVDGPESNLDDARSACGARFETGTVRIVMLDPATEGARVLEPGSGDRFREPREVSR